MLPEGEHGRRRPSRQRRHGVVLSHERVVAAHVRGGRHVAGRPGAKTCLDRMVSAGRARVRRAGRVDRRSVSRGGSWRSTRGQPGKGVSPVPHFRSKRPRTLRRFSQRLLFLDHFQHRSRSPASCAGAVVLFGEVVQGDGVEGGLGDLFGGVEDGGCECSGRPRSGVGVRPGSAGSGRPGCRSRRLG